MHVAIKPISEILQVNNYMYGLSFEGMNEDLARRQLRENANSLTWLLGHIASTRFDLLGLTGVKTASPWGDLFDTAINKTDQSKYPKLGEIKSVWEELTAKLMEKLPKVDKARLEQPISFKLPTQEQNVPSAPAFLAMHESYHIGQISTQRRMLGIDNLFDLAAAKRKTVEK
ncbi:MAG: DinB family protein [Candidatus Zixiibacteriota bacterium]